MHAAVQVNLKLFTPAPNKRRTVLLFVFRDRTRTPLARLVETWEADLAQMWAAITKPPQYESSSFTDFFEARPACTIITCVWKRVLARISYVTLPPSGASSTRLWVGARSQLCRCTPFPLWSPALHQYSLIL